MGTLEGGGENFSLVVGSLTKRAFLVSQPFMTLQLALYFQVLG